MNSNLTTFNPLMHFVVLNQVWILNLSLYLNLCLIEYLSLITISQNLHFPLFKIDRVFVQTLNQFVFAFVCCFSLNLDYFSSQVIVEFSQILKVLKIRYQFALLNLKFKMKNRNPFLIYSSHSLAACQFLITQFRFPFVIIKSNFQVQIQIPLSQLSVLT